MSAGRPARLATESTIRWSSDTIDVPCHRLGSEVCGRRWPASQYLNANSDIADMRGIGQPVGVDRTPTGRPIRPGRDRSEVVLLVVVLGELERLGEDDRVRRRVVRDREGAE